jgi:hypothetical protein
LLFLVGNKPPYEVNRDNVQAFGPNGALQLREIGVEVPDLVFLRMPVRDLRVIEARGKVFYSMDRRRSDRSMLQKGGFWVVADSPQALLDRERRLAASPLNDTGIEKRINRLGWEYLFVKRRLKEESRAAAKSWWSRWWRYLAREVPDHEGA